MNLPDEILLLIADYLDVKDITKCRLVCRRIAAFATDLIFRNGLSLLNTSGDFTRLLEQLRVSGFGARCKTLVIYTAKWRPCRRSEWKTYYLISEEASRARISRKPNTKVAYARYKEFLKVERNRTHASDADAFYQVLKRLPELDTVRISHLRCYSWNPLHYGRYATLQREIGVSHYIDIDIEDTLRRFLEALQANPLRVKRLFVVGTLDLDGLEPYWSGWSFPGIRHLEVRSLSVHYNESAVNKFLLAFPNLTQLSLRFLCSESSMNNLLGTLTWKLLRRLSLESVRSTEDEVFNMFRKHAESLEWLYLCNSYLGHGTWQSLFTRMRDLRTPVKIEAEGKLCESTGEMIIDSSRKACLDTFLTDLTKPWPFGVVET